MELPFRWAEHACTAATPCRGIFPRTFHVLWPTRELTFGGHKTEEREARTSVARLKELQPEWAVRVWTDSDCEALMAEAMPGRMPLYRALAPKLKQFDAIRTLILHVHGGIYLDLDVLCTRPLAPLLLGSPTTALLLRADWPRQNVEYRSILNMTSHRVVASGNHIMGSIARHPLWLYYLDIIFDGQACPAPTKSECEGSVIMHTGNGALERAVFAFLANHPKQRPSLRLLGERAFLNESQYRGQRRNVYADGQLVCRHLHSLSPVESQPGGDDDTKGQLKRSARHNANERRQSV
ncbi:hypothetical protein EMIHUDRAFT_105556 [Emiliania huxleyi CCMP1516]|uniref:Uncharacterized protein n=2 Tax=Emiliania huxleyi TaxID=2903 RepID=A0A0D3IEZ5_EMIH1|nr:hypothetical protein EMIHUDRAFT_105556 [Emiliania huxleyi CCMP1516]EOD09830.1 hypothetical protein EMIHUDRAFT_105556 [Emiliania huxleyi CCMP1516]|eukprot:XP_005762259.1 hypothetical protein EMIHUDRAFT_105556 [Emiliania huxleyi CCMP1516]